MDRFSGGVYVQQRLAYFTWKYVHGTKKKMKDKTTFCTTNEITIVPKIFFMPIKNNNFSVLSTLRGVLSLKKIIIHIRAYILAVLYYFSKKPHYPNIRICFKEKSQ